MLSYIRYINEMKRRNVSLSSRQLSLRLTYIASIASNKSAVGNDADENAAVLMDFYMW